MMIFMGFSTFFLLQALFEISTNLQELFSKIQLNQAYLNHIFFSLPGPKTVLWIQTPL